MRNSIAGALALLALSTSGTLGEERHWEGQASAEQDTIGCITLIGLGEAIDLWNEGRFRTATTTAGCSLVKRGERGEIVRGDRYEEVNQLARFLPDDGYGVLLVIRQHFKPQ